MTATILSAIVALSLAAAPRPDPVAPQPAAAAARDQHITVRIENDNFLDTRVYAVSEGLTWRLGTVLGLEQTTFTLPREMVTTNAEVRLVFAPVGSRAYWVSPPVIVSPGDQVVSRVGDSLEFSTIAAQ